MALVVTDNFHNVTGNVRQVIGTLAFDTSYPTGGEALSANAIGLAVIDHLEVDPNGGFAFQYDYTNGTVLVYYGDYNAAQDGSLIEVPDTTDLSTLTAVRFLATGV